MYKPRAVVRLMQRLGSFAAQIRRASYIVRGLQRVKCMAGVRVARDVREPHCCGMAPVEYGVRTVGIARDTGRDRIRVGLVRVHWQEL